MQRMSFLGNETEELVRYEWPISGLGVHPIGFGICRQSGLVLQTTTVTPEKMLEFYRETATYVNPAAEGRPTPEKVRDLERLLGLVRFCLGGISGSVLQLGSSDGYTLSCFREAGAKQVVGVEPGEQSREFARARYGVECLPGTAENFCSSQNFDLIILTHVLEHFYDPLFVLKRLVPFLTEEGTILIEVPLWERMDKQPMGVLNFEHLNYFCEETLAQVLSLAGFEITHSSKWYEVNKYPVITVVAKKTYKRIEYPSKYETNRALLKDYLDRELSFWKFVERKILDQASNLYPSFIYGAGIHTSQLLSNTRVFDELKVGGFIDSSETKWGKVLNGISISGPQALISLPAGANIIISSAASESDIADSILNVRTDLNLVYIYKD